MADEMQKRMMLHEAAKHDQILKNSLPVSIPLPRHASSCTPPAGRAVKPSPDGHDEPGDSNRYRSGDKASMQHVAISDVPWHCSDCISDRCSEACEPSCRRQSVAQKDERDENKNEKDGDEEGNLDFWEMTDEIADGQFVLSLVEQLRQRAGYGDEDCPVERARRIEKAAPRVFQAARVFREEMQRSDGSQVVPSVVNRILSQGVCSHRAAND